MHKPKAQITTYYNCQQDLPDEVHNLDVNQLSCNHAQEEQNHHQYDPNLSNCSLHKLRTEEFKAVHVFM